MASSSNIDDLLQCPICLDVLQDPKVLDCQHTFCSNCLKEHFLSSSRRLGVMNSIICPTCRLSTNLLNNSVDSLPVNYIVNDIIERRYGKTAPERPPGYAQQIQDRLQKMKKEDENEFNITDYIKPAGAALLGVLGGLLLAKGISKMRKDNDK